MGYSQENGYTPMTIEEILTEIMNGVNSVFGTSYTYQTFQGTGFYRYFYALAQKVQSNEIKLSEIFLKFQDYIPTVNETIVEPKVTNNGLLQVFENEGYVASIKPMIAADAGKANICVNVDSGAGDYAATKLAICTLIKNYIVAGIVTEGTESETITLSNGQAFDFKFHLPDKLTTYLKLTLTTSRNNQHVIDDTDTIKNTLLANIASSYKLGKDFEPEKYFTSDDAPYAGDILLEYSFDDSTYVSDVYEADFDELFDISLERVTIVQS